MDKQNRFYLIVFGLLLLFAGWYFLPQQKSDLAQQKNDLQQQISFKQNKLGNFSFEFKKESRRVYRLNYATSFGFNESITATGNSIRLDALLNYRVFEIQLDHVVIGFQLSEIDLNFGNTDLEEKLGKLYSELIFLKVANDGHFLEFILPRSRDDLKGLLELFSLLQIVLKQEESYQTIETSATGRYSSNYTVSQKEIHKTREKYLHQNDKSFDHVFKQSNAHITISADSEWLENIRVEEVIAVQDDEVNIVESNTTLSMEKIDIEPAMDLQIWTENRNITAIKKAFNRRKADLEVSFWKEEEMASQKKYIEENNISFESLIATISTSESLQSYQELIKYLVLYPDDARKILPIIETESSSLSSALINVLQQANTDEAKLVLATIVKHEAISSLNKQRASIALGGIETPTELSINTLLEVIPNRENMDAVDLSNSAILSLGRISHEIDSSAYMEIRNQISSLISYGEDDQIKRIAILAAANSKTEEYFTEIRDSLESESKDIRYAAIEALGNIDNLDSRDVLLIEYDNSADSNIKQEIIKALTHQKADQMVVEKMRNELEGNLDARLRNEIIRSLCKTAQAFPNNKEFLERELSSQADRELMKLIIRAIR